MDSKEESNHTPIMETPDRPGLGDVDGLVSESPAQPIGAAEELLVANQEEERISIASNWTLVWWRFRKNKLAVLSGLILIFLVIIVLVPQFFATTDPEETEARLAFIPIQSINWIDEGRLKPWLGLLVNVIQ
jgi:hypothetical protein